MLGRNLSAALIALFSVCTIEAFGEGTAQVSNNISSDPEYEQLAPLFVVREDGSKVLYSEAMEYFLDMFRQQLYSSRFSPDDAKKIETHSINFAEDLRQIYNASNAYNYIALSKFDDLTADQWTFGRMTEYADVIDNLEREEETRIENHHKQLIGNLSDEGARVLSKIVEEDMTAEIRNEFATGARMKASWDMRSFIEAHPDVLARQLYIESEQHKRIGPPKELVYVDELVATDDTGAEIRAIRLAPKKEEE